MGRFKAQQKIIMLLVFFTTYIYSLRLDNIKIVSKSAMMTLSLNNRPLYDPVACGLHLRKCFGEKRLREREREKEKERLKILTF